MLSVCSHLAQHSVHREEAYPPTPIVSSALRKESGSGKIIIRLLQYISISMKDGITGKEFVIP
jgi:hypothetical protein